MALLVAVVLAGTATSSARASAVRVRWNPTAIGQVAGYRIYVRPAGTPYGRPIDVGLPTPAGDGTVEALVAGLRASAYHVAVTSYAADGVESPLSGELAVGILNPCVIDQCAAIGSCAFGLESDGTWCMHAGETDPCAAIGACAAGACTASALDAAQLVSTRVHLGLRRHEGALSVHGAFSADPALDPRATGATLQLADETGSLLYHASVPGEAFTVVDWGNAFRYRISRREARAGNGLSVLYLFRSGGRFRVRARAETSDLRTALAQADLRATLRFGSTCTRDLGLVCHDLVGGGISCR